MAPTTVLIKPTTTKTIMNSFAPNTLTNNTLSLSNGCMYLFRPISAFTSRRRSVPAKPRSTRSYLPPSALDLIVKRVCRSVASQTFIYQTKFYVSLICSSVIIQSVIYLSIIYSISTVYYTLTTPYVYFILNSGYQIRDSISHRTTS